MTRISLNEGWTLSAQGISPLPVLVPGDVHSALLANGLIADPFYGTQAEACRWVEDKTWVYETEFTFDGFGLSGTARLVFHGIDTFAEVFVNERSAGRAANMLVAQEFDITNLVKTGTNSLRVVIDPVKAHVPAEADPRLWYSYDRDRVWARKAQFGWRWDWGPRLLTAGLWREVEMVLPGAAEIKATFFRTLEIGHGWARVSVSVDVSGEAAARGAEAGIRLGAHVLVRAPLADGRASVEFEVPDPRLWWTHDLGEPYLYDLEVTLTGPEGVFDRRREKVGIRTVELRRRAADGSALFQFVLNGAPLFARGANWIPAHSFVGTVGAADYRAWVDLAREGNMTMLRVWGGGLYEKPSFYEECDRQGLLVWQDFLFTCSSYPDQDPAFVAAVEAEVRSVVPRLRNHPCLALWCGNNEIQWIHEQKEMERPEERLYGRHLWEVLFPRWLAELDPSRTYWPSSPFGGDDPNGDEEGDKHNWQVWAGQIYPQVKGKGVQADNSAAGVSWRHFAHDFAKFSSEFGLHAWPVRQTLEACLPPEDLVYGSFGLKFRNKDKRPNRGRLLMEGSTGLPATFDQAIDFSMLAQAEGLRFGVEHYRRRRPDCAGALVWQLNDCWPTLSWSVIDFHRRPKAGYWTLKRAFAPLLLSWKQERPDLVELWVVNDTLEPWQGEVEVELHDFFGHSAYRRVVAVSAPAQSSVKAAEFSKNLMNVTYSNFEYLAARPLVPGPQTTLMFFEEHKDLNLAPATLSARWLDSAGDIRRLEVATDRLARMVRLEGDLDGLRLDDNYFDLEPGQMKIVGIRGNLSGRPLCVRALNAASVASWGNGR